MWGAIIGDIAGSPYEYSRTKVPAGNFDLFPPEANYTDDTLMTLAVYAGLKAADGDVAKGPEAVAEAMRHFGRTYNLPCGGYGGGFWKWLHSDEPHPYNSFGNGSAMRVSSVGWLFGTLAETLQWAEITAAVTHNHPEGIKGAQGTAAAIYLARTGATKDQISDDIQTRFGYDLSHTWGQVEAGDTSGMACQNTVPEALACFKESSSFEHCIRLAIRLNYDTDTRAAIAGSIAEAYYGIQNHSLKDAVITRLNPDLKNLLDDFDNTRDALPHPRS